MLMEAEPYHFTPRDVSAEAWTPDSTPVHLLNWAWHQFRNSPEHYSEWERQAITAFCGTPPVDAARRSNSN